MHGDEHLTRYWFFFLFFIGNMLLLVLSDNLIQMMIGWEGVGLCSYGLIGYYYRDPKERWLGGPPPTKMFPPSHAGMKAFIVTGIGDVFLLGAIFIIYNYAGTLNFVQLINTAPQWMAAISVVPGLLSLTAILFLGGPIGKSAQFPLHEWLPEAMAGPTAVSALIHAATMVKAGVYLVARMAPAFYIGTFAQHLAEAQTYFVAIAVVGAFTAFLAASQAMVALELKKVLAYSTVSQIGFMMLGLGVSGLGEGNLLPGLTAGIFHLVSHALFKAALFLGAGCVIHAVETIYMDKMGGLGKQMPFTKILMLLATLSLAGIPPFSGFWSKDAIFVASLNAGLTLTNVLYVVAVVTALMTLVYSARYIYMVFYGEKSHFIHELEEEGHHVHESPAIMWGPIAVLVAVMLGISALGLVGFFVPSLSPEVFIEGQMTRMVEGLNVPEIFASASATFTEPVVARRDEADGDRLERRHHTRRRNNRLPPLHGAQVQRLADRQRQQHTEAHPQLPLEQVVHQRTILRRRSRRTTRPMQGHKQHLRGEAPRSQRLGPEGLHGALEPGEEAPDRVPKHQRAVPGRAATIPAVPRPREGGVMTW